MRPLERPYKPQCPAPTVTFSEGRMNRTTYKVILEQVVLPSALTKMIVFSSRTMLHATQPSHQGVVGGSPDPDPVIATPISRPENLWNVIQRKMDGNMPSIKAELLEFLHQEWHKVTQ